MSCDKSAVGKDTHKTKPRGGIYYYYSTRRGKNRKHNSGGKNMAGELCKIKPTP